MVQRRFSSRVVFAAFFLTVISAFAFASGFKSNLNWLIPSQAAALTSSPLSETGSINSPAVTPADDVIGTCDTAGPIEVESSGGTTAPTAYGTLKLAFDAINAGTHTGTVAVEVCGNTTETATAALNSGAVGPASYTAVTIRPVGAGHVIEGSIVGAIVKLNGADNVTIDGRQGGTGTARDLTVRNNSTATLTASVWLASVAAGNGASSNIVRNLEIAAGQTAIAGTNTTIGILMGGSTISLTATDGNDNDNNQFIFNRIVRARYGIATRGVTTNNNEGLVITDNIVGPGSFGGTSGRIGKAGIFLQADTGAVISRNTVQFVGGDLANTTAGADRCGICVGGENWSVTDSTTITSGDYTVTKNTIHDIVEERTFSAIGIKLGTTRSGVATNNLVANNFIYNVRSDGTSSDQPVGIGYSNGHSDRIVFNSIAMTGDMDPGAAAVSATYGNGIRVTQANGTNNTNLTLMNNSIYLDLNSSTSANRYYAITLNSAAYTFGTGGLNFNNYYINPANVQLRTGGFSTTGTANSATTEFQTLANWQAALTAPQDANSKQADPLYASVTSDLHIPTLSPNVDMGTSITGVADDIDAQIRPNGSAPDIGADEFYASPGSVQLSSASYTATELAGTTTVTVTRTGGSTGAISINYATSNGTATGGASCGVGVDYVTSSGTLNWADSDSAAKTFNVTLCNDGANESSETFNIALSNPTGGVSVGTPNAAVVTILNSTVFSGAVNVGTGEAYISLTNPGGLFEAINNGGLSGNTVININSDLTAETGAVALNEFSGGFTLKVMPGGGAARLISGSNANALLDFNGADGVTIDGLNSGGNSLTVRSTGVGGAIRFINDASGNTVTNSTLEANANSSVIFISTGTVTGNDNNSITNNVIRDRSDLAGAPFNSINLIGSSAAISNSNTLISNNQITNFLQAGIVVGTSDNVTFTNNNISQSASRTTALFGVAVNSAAGTNLFQGNLVHDLTTTLGATGMTFNDARDTTVARNRVYNFTSTAGSTGLLTGINFNGSSGTPATLTVVNNMVSIVPSSTNNQSILGIRDFGFGGNTFNAYYNSVLIDGTGSGTANTYACERGSGAPTTSTWTDNICFNNRTGGTGNHFAMGDSSDATGTLTLNYNIYVGTGATAGNFFDRSASTTVIPVAFAAWQTGGRDANSQAANPGGNYTVANMFATASDLHLNTSGTNPASDAGTPIAGVTTDFDGNSRSATTPEIGADEIFVAVPGTLALSSATYTVGEAGGTVTLTVNRTGGTDGAVAVDYALAGGTATGGASCGGAVDYVNAGGTVTFAAGEATKTFNVTICNDTSVEGSETFNATLSNATGGATIGSPSAAAVTITDDDTSGTSGTINVGAGQTYTSLTNAGGIFEALNTLGITGNVTINITSDLTGELGTNALNENAGGFTVTIKPSGAARSITGSTAATNGLIKINGADNVTIDGSLSNGTDRSLTITNTGAGAVIWIATNATSGANSNTVKNCNLVGVGLPTGTQGIIAGSGASLGAAAVFPQNNNTIQNNLIKAVQNAAFIAGNVATQDDGWQIIGNDGGSTVAAEKLSFRGFLLGNAKNFVISQNRISGINSSTTTSSTMSGLQLNGVMSNGTVTRNVFKDIRQNNTTGWGSNGIFSTVTSTASNILIANNFISDIASIGFNDITAADNGYGIMISTGGGFKIYDNTVRMNTSQTTATSITSALNIASGVTTASSIDLRGNILANTETVGTRFAVINASTQAAAVFVDSNYNDYFAQNVGRQGATTFTTLANWQGATGKDANSLAVDPLFVSATDLHIQAGSPVNNAGTPLAGVTVDFDGETRSATTPEIGADEIVAPVAPGTVQFAQAFYTVGEGAGTVTISVTRTGGSSGAIGVNYVFAGGTATGASSCSSGTDYAAVSGTLNWADGDNAPKTFNVTICEDVLIESNENFLSFLNTPTGGATVGTQSSTDVTITDNDAPVTGTLAISDVRVFEGNAGTVNAVFAVTYSGSTSPASVQYATSNGTAVAGVDYVATSGTLTFGSAPLTEGGIPSTQTKFVTVVVNGDLNKEANETFFVNLTNPIGTGITDAQGVGIIIDEDRAYVSDFDRDLKADYSVFRGNEGFWYVLRSTNGSNQIVPLGSGPGDLAAPGDYDADGKADFAVFRPSQSNWLVLNSSDNTLHSVTFGANGDKPVQGDYDGDGKTDIAIFRPSTGAWWILQSATSSTTTVNFGVATDRPVQGDYDGDARTDIAVYRDGVWYVLRSASGSVQIQNFGVASDKPVSGDFDGDGKFDFAVYRDGAWWVLNSLTGNFGVVQWGVSTDIPVSADFDADGTTDHAVYRPSTGIWYVLPSSTGNPTGVQWGVSTDKPVPAAYLPQ